MNRQTRKIIFGFFLFLFIGIGTYLIILTNGWMIDFSTLKIVKTGSISLTFTPKDARVFINNTEQNKTNSFLSSNIVFKKLLPGTYRIYIEKDGYLSWKKTLAVKSEVVTAVNSIFLFPKEWEKIEIATGTKDFWITEKGILTQQDGGIFFENKSIYGNSIHLAKPNSHTIITEKKGSFYYINLETPDVYTNISDIFKTQKKKLQPIPGALETIQKIEFHPLNKEQFIISTQKGIYELDPKKSSLEQVLSVKTLSFSHVGNKWIYGIDASSTLILVDAISKTTKEFPLDILHAEKAETNSDDSLLFLLSKSGSLFVISLIDGSIQKTFSHVSSFSLSPNEKKIALALDTHSIIIYYFNEEFIDVHQEKDSRRILPIFPFSIISNMQWSDSASEHLIFQGNSKLVFSETDERTPINYITPFSDIKKFEEQSHIVYILTNSGDLFTTKPKK